MSMAAGNDTVAMVLLEAMTLLALGGDEVLAIVADEPLPAVDLARRSGPLRSPPRSCWRRTRCARRPAQPPPAVLEDLLQMPAVPDAPDRPQEVDSPCAAILPLIAALGHGRSGRVNVSPTEDPRWSIMVRDARSFPRGARDDDLPADRRAGSPSTADAASGPRAVVRW